MSSRISEALQESAFSIEDVAWWFDMHEALPCMSLLERDGTIVARNAVAREMTGAGLGDIAPVDEVLGNLYRSGRQDRERFDGRLTRMGRSPVRITGVSQNIVREGVAYGLILLMETEDDLPSSAEVSGSMLKDLLDAAPEATAITRDGRILHVNRRFVELFGFTLTQCVGKLLTPLVVPGNRQHEAEMLLRILQNNERSSLQTTRKNHVGEEIDVLLTMSRVRLGDDAAGLLITYQDMRQRKREARLQHVALHDTVTGLANRALFLNRLQLTMARFRRRPDRNFAVLLLDLDGFKKVNATLGPGGGDAVLMLVRDRLLGCLRPQDTVARFGGDEFALLLDESGSIEQAHQIARRIQSEIQTAFLAEGMQVRISASMGIVMGTAVYQAAEEMTRDAIRAMSQARMAGTACHVFFEQPEFSPIQTAGNASIPA